jgi:two-component system response regulator AtoC
MKCGADDYLAKPASQEQLLSVIQGMLAKRAGAKPVFAQNPRRSPEKSAVNPSAWMQSMDTMLRQVAVSDAPVLLQGETGSGKEVVARMLHAASSRAANPFLKVNCAALPSELVESELFGYERGAFTGAIRRKPGKFDLANSGTIFLDEIGDMDFRLQAKLLQVLQDQEFQRLGGEEMVRVNVRVMAATHSDLEKGIQENRFREDLYYRLNVVNIHVPPLRDRPDEILPLAQHFLDKHHVPGHSAFRITPDLAEALAGYDWPGNVRELENTMRRCLALRDCQAVADELRARMGQRVQNTAPVASLSSQGKSVLRPTTPTLHTVSQTQRQAEIDAIVATLNRTRWNRKQAATLLRVDYKALLYKMKKLGIDPRPGETIDA